MERINVTSSSMPPYEEYIEMIKPLWDSRFLTNCGVLHEKLEEKLKIYLDVPFVSLHSNGHMALYNAINALNLKGEVITTPYTFVSTVNAIVQNGLIPVFCDINEDDYTIDAEKIEKLITKDTCAIVAVHVYGNPCDVEKIKQIAKKYNLKVIYDAAHAFGVSYKNKAIGNFGDMSMMSFHATKVFHTVEGGAILYNDEKYLNVIKSLRNFGLDSDGDCKYPAMNTKMSEFHAAMGLCNLEHIDEYIEKRKIVYERYQENLKDIAGIILPKIKENVKSNYIYFPIVVDKERCQKSRDEIMQALLKENIYSRKYFYPAVNDMQAYTKYYRETPIARKISLSVLCLPLYSDLALETVDKICNIIKECVKND